MTDVFGNNPPPFMLPCFGACLVHIAVIIMLGLWTDIREEAFSLNEEIGPSIKANLVTLAPPKPKAPPKSEKSDPKEITQPIKKNLDALIERLDQANTRKESVDETIEESLILKQATEEDREGERDQDEDAEQEAQSKINQALEYYQRNRVLVERNFNVGTAAQRKLFEGLVVRMKIFLDVEGRLKDVDILNSSGNRVFDAEAERAVRRVKRFILPADPVLVERYFRQITMEFRLSGY